MNYNKLIKEIYRVAPDTMGCSERVLFVVPKLLNILQKVGGEGQERVLIDSFVEFYDSIKQTDSISEDEESEPDEAEENAEDEDVDEFTYEPVFLDDSINYVIEHCERILIGDSYLMQSIRDTGSKLVMPLISKNFFFHFVVELSLKTEREFKVGDQFRTIMLQERFDELQILEKNISEKINTTEKRIDMLNSSALASISIFTAIVMAFVGGF
jgi:hypothetical protein